MSLVSWYANKISEDNEVETTEVIDNIIKVVNKEKVTYRIAFIEENEVSQSTLLHLDLGEIDFILNHNKEAYIHGCFYGKNKPFNLSVGGLGDLLDALASKNLHNYLTKEMRFVIGGLEQHGKVSSIERLDNRRLLIKRRYMPSVTILVINDYDVTSETVRNNKKTFKQFDAILCSNPNSRSSSSALNTADSLNISLLKYGQLLGRLNNRKF